LVEFLDERKDFGLTDRGGKKEFMKPDANGLRAFFLERDIEVRCRVLANQNNGQGRFFIPRQLRNLVFEPDRESVGYFLAIDDFYHTSYCSGFLAKNQGKNYFPSFLRRGLRGGGVDLTMCF